MRTHHILMMLKEHSVCYLKNVWFTLGPILNISTINSDFSLNKLKLLLMVVMWKDQGM